MAIPTHPFVPNHRLRPPFAFCPNWHRVIGPTRNSLPSRCVFSAERKSTSTPFARPDWEWGLLAKRQADGKTWYRLAPQHHVAPPHYLILRPTARTTFTADLTAIPFEALEQIVAISDQRWSGGRQSLLLTPNFVKLGRADDELLASEPVQWLVEQTQPFAEAFVKLSDRRGKTILHENLYIAAGQRLVAESGD